MYPSRRVLRNGVLVVRCLITCYDIIGLFKLEALEFACIEREE